MKKLRYELFKNRDYDPKKIPLKNLTYSINVTVSLYLVHIRDLVSKKNSNFIELI
jgi:hypothetical protein